MISLRSAFGASPTGGRSRRTGVAGSVAAAWLKSFAVGGVVALAGAVSVHAAEATRTPQPVIEPAKAGTQCIAEPAKMRRDHPAMLKHQRDETVHGGIRGASASLKACIECHASPATGSVAKAETNFCVSCHSYAAVRIDCFECHTTKSGRAVAKQP